MKYICAGTPGKVAWAPYRSVAFQFLEKKKILNSKARK
jgi:hypothetical protein